MGSFIFVFVFSVLMLTGHMNLDLLFNTRYHSDEDRHADRYSVEYLEQAHDNMVFRLIAPYRISEDFGVNTDMSLISCAVY